MNILIVDDDEIDMALIKNALNSTMQGSFQIHQADSVIKAKEIIEENSFDVILLDYHMPEVNGIELIIDIRSRPHLGNTAIIVISAAHGNDIALECIEAGAQDFIAKTDINHIEMNKAILHSKKRFELEQKMQDSYLAIKSMAETDQLTGLYNRYYFNENLKFMTESCKRTGLSVGMLALDIDDFKHVNDTLGHTAGDQLLIAFVSRIKECLRINDGFARLGGDEFAITLPDIHYVDEVSMVARRILDKINEPFIIDDKRFHCTISIGAALYPNDAKNRDELIKCADIAMYRAKQNGKNTLRFYESHYQKEFNLRFEIQNAMNDIIEQSNFRLFYQPVFNANEKLISGVEALIRWPDTQPFYTPDEFIPIAEQTRLIHEIGKWVIDTAIKDLSRWQAAYNPELSMAINISAVQLQDPELVNYLTESVKKYQILPNTIVLEITETAFLGSNNKTLSMLNNLSANKFKIALDDFGMGYSSISHLSNYPIDIVKLDRSLQSTYRLKNKKNLLEPLAIMLKLLDFVIVAEGIETEAQLDLCHQLKIDKIQGYFLGKPMPPDHLQDLLENQ